MKLAFVYPGYGSQWRGMGAGLMGEERFRTVIRECGRYFSRYVDWHVEEELIKPAVDSRMEDPLYGLASGCFIEIGITELLKSRGIVPDAVLGHSYGEAAAAYAAGVLNLEDAVRVIRNIHIQLELAAGHWAMAHIGAAPGKIREAIKEGSQVFIAGINSPKATLVSGDRQEINRMVTMFEKAGIFCRVLNISAPLHTPLIKPYREELFANLRHIRPAESALPIYSAMHGRLATTGDFSGANWAELTIKTIEFVDSIQAMINDGYSVFLEISPHPILSFSIREIFADIGKEDGAVIGTLKRDKDERQELFNGLARLSLLGCEIPQEMWNQEDQRQFRAALAGLSGEGTESMVAQETAVFKELRKAPLGKKEELMVQLIKESIREVLNREDMPLDDMHLGFFQMGFNSLTAITFKEVLSRRLGISFPELFIFQYPDMGSLSRYLLSRVENRAVETPGSRIAISDGVGEGKREAFYREPLAIIGIACRFPGGANNIEAFWDMLKNGKDAVCDIPADRWDADAYYSEELEPGKSITRRGNFLTGFDVTEFDAGFFKISPREAESLDPQQRMLLEVTVEALENSAIPVLSLRDREVGIYVGICMDDYKRAYIFSEDLRRIDAYSGSGSMFSPAAGRISYFLGIRGPAVSIDTACSSSLTALHFAVQSLRNRECEIALAAGVNCMLSPHHFVYASQLNVISRDGTCKTFDEKADGYSRGEGCGVVVLKPLAAAQRDNDHILAVVRGSAINQDGASTGLTAPNGIAQQEVISKALADGGILPESVDYLEAHGAGTALGDPIEIMSAADVYGKNRKKSDPLLVGSVKTNLGHLEGASGIAGVIKTVLALYHKTIPPHLHVSTPNRRIDWEHIPVQINTGLTPWKRDKTPRRAGISAFGFSGSNAHVIMEEAPEIARKHREAGRPVHILNISAKSAPALQELVGMYRSYLNRDCLPGLNDICYTAAVGRSHFDCRFSVVGNNRQDILRRLEVFLSNPAGSPYANLGRQRLSGPVVFLYTGQGSQYVGMAGELYENEPVFKTWLDRCDGLFHPHINASIVELLYGPGSSDGATAGRVDEAIYAQPVIFSVEYALSKLWQSWGVEPSLVMGHSIGEYAAACIAGVLTLEDAVKLVAIRGKLMQSATRKGQMVGLLTAEIKARDFIAAYQDVSLAAVNAPENVTISGDKTSIKKVVEAVKKANIFIEPLNISHAFHSVLMEPYIEAFIREMEGIVFSPPELPLISTIIGNQADKEISDPVYWGRHFSRTVRFYDSMKLALAEGYRLYIEIGGTATLSGLASQCIAAIDNSAGNNSSALFLPSLRKGKNACEQLYSSLSRLYLQGIDIDWQRFYQSFAGDKALSPALPTYPFQRNRYWHKGLGRLFSAVSTNESATAIEIKKEKEENKPGGDIKWELKEMIHSVSGLLPDHISADVDLFSLGLDSLILAELRRKINGRYGIDISLNEFFLELTTLDKIIRHIEDKQSEAGEFSLQALKGVRHITGPGIFPMSSVQQRLYVLSQSQEGQQAYHIPIAVRVRGPFDVKKVEAVFKELIKRHDILRTGMEIQDEQFIQQVYEAEAVEFSVMYTKTGADNTDALINEILRPFDLSKPPLLRVSVTELSPELFIFIMNFHHNIMDGSSLAILIRDFTALYRGHKLPPIQVQYSDFVQWEQEYTGSPEFRAHGEFWAGQLSDQPPVLELPLDFARPETLDFAGKFSRFDIGREKTRQLKQLAQKTGTSLNMLLLALFNVLLFKLTGQEDILVGIPAAVREHRDFQHTLGMFTNTLVLRSQVRGRQSFLHFVREVKVCFLQAYTHQDYPYEALVSRLSGSLNTGHNPFFDVIFSYEKGDRLLFKLPGLTFTGIDVNTGASPFDLFCQVIEEEGHLKTTINYRTCLYKEETINRWGQYYERLMDEIISAPETLLCGLEIFTEKAKSLILMEFNDTFTAYPREKTLHQLFQEQVETAADHIALLGPRIGQDRQQNDKPRDICSVMGSIGREVSTVTYGELKQKSDELARELNAKGVCPDALVALMVERSVEMIICILGILKAGGAYLPIDPGYPAERIDYMLEDCGVKLLVTAGFLDKVLKKNPERIFIDSFEALDCSTSQRLNFSTSHASDLAYVIYTSGTTGKPKGTLVTHSNAVRVVRDTNYIEITGKDRILQLSDYAFDGSVFDIYGALLNGAALILLTRGDVLSVAQLATILKKEFITVFFLTTALFNVLVDEALESLEKVRKVLFGGERVSVEHSRKALAHLGRDRIIHVYGPTETTVYATSYSIADIAENALTIPIGKPIANTVAYILDAFLNPVPLMVYGELYIGGDGVCRGYLNNPGLTFKRFINYKLQITKYKQITNYKLQMTNKRACITVPGKTNNKTFLRGGQGQEYAYKTGDIVRWLPAGDIEFLGRKDQQVKIRGFRIEMGEIESQLLAYPGVKEAVVMAIETQGTGGDKSLAAYIVTGLAPEGIAVNVKIEELKSHLSSKLPDFMVPGFIGVLEKLPLTANGKLDRKALPEPVVQISDTGTYTAPRNEREKRLVWHWAEILGIEAGKIGIDVNFFKLGGHSLKGVRLVARIHKEFAIRIPLEVLFKAPTIRGLSEYMAVADKGLYISPRPVEKKEYYPASALQKRLYILDRGEDVKIAYNIARALVIEGEAGVDRQRFEQIFRLLIKRHESLRTSFSMVKQEPVQKVHDQAMFSLGYSESGAEELQRLIQEFIIPFDLGKAPLLRAKLVRISRQTYLFLYDVHHIALDGTSLGILQRDFMRLYRGEKLAALAIQYKDYCIWQCQNRDRADRSNQNEYKQKESYWLERFKGELPKLDIYTDFPRPEVQSFAGEQLKFTVEKELTRDIYLLMKETGTTLYMVLLAFYTILLSRYSGQEDITVGTPAAGREVVDIEPVIGLFINPLPMRNFPGGKKTFREFLEEVKQTTIEAYENQGYSFGDLVEKLALTDDLSRNPVFEAELLVHNMEMPGWDAEDLSFTPYEFAYPVTQMDISLETEEADERLYFKLLYSTALFKRSTMEGFVNSFREIIQAVLTKPLIKLEYITVSHDLLSSQSTVYQETSVDFTF